MTPFPWNELSERCARHVAETLAFDILPPDHNAKPYEERVRAVSVATDEMREASYRLVNELSHMELLEIIGEVVQAHENGGST